MFVYQSQKFTPDRQNSLDRKTNIFKCIVYNYYPYGRGNYNLQNNFNNYIYHCRHVQPQFY